MQNTCLCICGSSASAYAELLYMLMRMLYIDLDVWMGMCSRSRQESKGRVRRVARIELMTARADWPMRKKYCFGLWWICNGEAPRYCFVVTRSDGHVFLNQHFSFLNKSASVNMSLLKSASASADVKKCICNIPDMECGVRYLNSMSRILCRTWILQL